MLKEPLQNPSGKRALRVFLKQLVQDRRLPFQPSLDPFYSAENQRALEVSIVQLSRGETVNKTLDELQAMSVR